MMMDPIADLLTRIRNGQMARKPFVEAPGSKMAKNILRVLQDNGYIAGYEEKLDKNRSILQVMLRYDSAGKPMADGIKRISKPGLRVYSASSEIPHVRSGLGISVISTSKGVMSCNEARKENVGGEILCHIW